MYNLFCKFPRYFNIFKQLQEQEKQWKKNNNLCKLMWNMSKILFFRLIQSVW